MAQVGPPETVALALVACMLLGPTAPLAKRCRKQHPAGRQQTLHQHTEVTRCASEVIRSTEKVMPQRCSRTPSHANPVQLDAVCSYLNLWDVADRVRAGIADARRRPGYTAGGSARAISVNLDVDVGGAGRWAAGSGWQLASSGSVLDVAGGLHTCLACVALCTTTHALPSLQLQILGVEHVLSCHKCSSASRAALACPLGIHGTLFTCTPTCPHPCTMPALLRFLLILI